jgi:hypothetical protein
VLFERGRRGLALEGFDVGRDRDGFNVLQVPVPGPLAPAQELFDCPVLHCLVGQGTAIYAFRA